MMRFRGGGVGHKSTREATDFFKKDRDHLDVPRQTKIDDEEDSDQWPIRNLAQALNCLPLP